MERTAPHADTPVCRLIRQRLQHLGLSLRMASVMSGLSHNTLRVVLDGARPKLDTCDALEPVLQVPPGVLRLLAGWPLEQVRYRYDEQWVRTLLELAPWSRRQQVINYLLAWSEDGEDPPQTRRRGNER